MAHAAADNDALARFKRHPSSMISCQSIKQFLSANIDEHASHFILMTTAGTLLAHNYSAPVPLLRKFCAFAGPTWRLHDTALAQTTELATVAAAKDGFFQGRVLKFIVKDDVSGLESLFVEQDDQIGVVVYVKERLLIAALKPKREPISKTDDLAERLTGLSYEKDDATGAKEAGEAITNAEIGIPGTTTGEGAEKDEYDPEDSSSRNGIQSGEVSEGKSKEPAEDEHQAKKPGKMRILELRAEAIAEELAQGELKDFRMPKDFQ